MVHSAQYRIHAPGCHAKSVILEKGVYVQHFLELFVRSFLENFQHLHYRDSVARLLVGLKGQTGVALRVVVYVHQIGSGAFRFVQISVTVSEVIAYEVFVYVFDTQIKPEVLVVYMQRNIGCPRSFETEHFRDLVRQVLSHERGV